MGNHVLFKTGIRRCGSKESGFFYRYPGTNETVREERVLRRIENLKVPPDAARIGYNYRSASVALLSGSSSSAGRTSLPSRENRVSYSVSPATGLVCPWLIILARVSDTCSGLRSMGSPASLVR